MSSDTAQVLSMLYDWALPPLHIYPVPDLEVPCTFCHCNDETIPHLFFTVKYRTNFGEISNQTVLALPTLFFPSTLKTSSATIVIQKMAVLNN